MFVSFFPRPVQFFVSAIVWTAFLILMWYGGWDWQGAKNVPTAMGWAAAPDARNPIIGAQVFWSPSFLWFYFYYTVAVGTFASFWLWLEPHRWALWSILGSALIIFVTYFLVQVSVAVNNWYGPFYNLIQTALSKSAPVTASDFYKELLVFARIAFIAVTVSVLNRFFVSHYIFRWRTAMNDYYMANWSALRTIEGASQRVQDDTMRFASTMEALGVNLIDAIMTLFAFLPILLLLSENVTELPLVGPIPYALVVVAILWSAFGTGFLALIGIRLPGLEFRNQRVEAAYRKELVYGEDDPARATPPTVAQLFEAIRKNYFRLYFNYAYFNIGRISYLQLDNIFPYIILVPTMVAGKITLGPFQQILNAFQQVRHSFQYLVSSWTTIVELVSIYKRLRAFEATLHGEPLDTIEKGGPPDEQVAAVPLGTGHG